MPRYGAHAFCWIGDWTTEEGNRAIQLAAEAGFDFIEIPLLRPAEFDALSHKAALDAAGIEATVSLVLPEDLHMPDNPQGALDFLTQALNHTEALEATFLGGCIGYALGYMTGEPPTDGERSRVIESLGKLAEDAKRRGITLGLEAVNRYETYLYNTLGDVRKTVEGTGADNIVVHADTYHMNIEEQSFYKAIVDCGSALGYIHMSESHRGLVGTGTVIWPDIFKGLKEINYSGPLVLESFSAINPDLAMATRLWRPISVPPDQMARDGLSFLQNHADEYELA